MKTQKMKSILIMYFVIGVSAFNSFGQSQIDKQTSKVDTILFVVKIEGSPKEVIGTTNIVSENLFDLELNWIRTISNITNQNTLVKYQGILNNPLIRYVICIEIDKSITNEIPAELRLKLGDL
jgi:hypothetical protein